MEPVEAGEEVRAHRRIHRIHLLGAVERDGHHEAIGRALDEQVTKDHGSGPREAGKLRGWPERGAAWLRSASAVIGAGPARPGNSVGGLSKGRPGSGPPAPSLERAPRGRKTPWVA